MDTERKQLFEMLPALHEELVEVINDDCLDILNEVDAGIFANQVIKIAQRIVIFMASRPQMSIHGVIGDFTKKAIWNVKVCNLEGGWVSVSDNSATCVSDTLYKPFHNDFDDGWLEGLKNLAQMINEAWYKLTND